MASTPVTVVPANEAPWEVLQAVFGTRGNGARCQCQRYRLQPGESFGSFPVEERAHRLRMQTDGGHPESAETSGLVAYLDVTPVGWCGTARTYADAGLVEVARPSKRRAVMRIDFG